MITVSTLASDLLGKVGIFHPGFNKTGMTAKYQDIWDVEGAVDAIIGANRILYDTGCSWWSDCGRRVWTVARVTASVLMNFKISTGAAESVALSVCCSS
jgi:hypothetical protein